MDERIGALSEREKQTLRLLLAGHDAKSAAQALGVSVHTVNERLRDARRKIGVTSSREAARALARAEPAGSEGAGDPEFLGDKTFGVGGAARAEPYDGPRHRRGGSLPWLAGGLLIMLALAAALVLVMQGSEPGATQAPTGAAPPSASTVAADKVAADAALAWISLLDDQQWGESWGQAGALFRSQITQGDWTARVEPLRRQFGAVTSRSPTTVTHQGSLPGAPAGDYVVVQFATGFASKPGAVETVVLAREGAVWKVNGYFIR